MPWLETFLVACIDVALAAQNAVVAAESIGLSTVYIGAMRNDPERVADAARPAAAVASSCSACASAMPTEQAAGEVKPRLPQAIVLHRDALRRVDAEAPSARPMTPR